MNIDLILGAILTAGLLGYFLGALFRPERF